MKTKNINKLIALILTVFIVISFSSCSGISSNNKQSRKTVIDCIGREVEVPSNPKRVAALDSFAGEAMIMLDAGKKMVAAPNGVKLDKLLQEIYPKINDIGVPMSGATINAESLLSLNVDLVLIKADMYYAEGEIDKVEKLGIPYLVIGYYNMDEQIKALDLIGEVLGEKYAENANKINEYYKNVINMAKKKAKEIPLDKKVRVYHSINESVRTDGKHSLGNDWITTTGCINVSTQDDTLTNKGDYFVGIEQIFTWNPDVLICNENVTKEFLLKDKKWSGLKAVSEGKVYNIPVGATRWGQRGSLETFFAILWLGKTIYPEYYKDVDLKKQVMTFYKEYLGLNISEETYNKILSGDGIRGKSLSLDK